MRKTQFLVLSLTFLPISVHGAEKPKAINTAYKMNIEFDQGKSDIKPDYDKDIRNVTDYLKNYPYTKCEIRGYTDNVGKDAVNLKLSQDRAESVRHYMIDKLGIAPARIIAKGYGS